MIQGVDVFSGYGLIDWNLVAQSGVRFAWVKCWEGNEGKDPAFERNVQRARDAGIAVGGYHFAFPLPTDPKHPGRGALEQAEMYFKACSGLGSRPGELSPALDLEWPPPNEWAKWGCSAQQISDWGRECAEAITLLWGRLPILYTYPWWWSALSKSDVSWAGRYPLWMAAYNHPGPGMPADGKRPPVPAPWTEWAAWQYSAEGSKERVPGIPACPVDRDCIRDESTFELLTGNVRLGPDDDTLPDLRIALGPQPVVTVLPDTVMRCALCHRASCNGDCPEAA